MQVVNFGDNVCKGKSFVNKEKQSFLMDYLSEGRHARKDWIGANALQSMLVLYLPILTKIQSREHLRVAPDKNSMKSADLGKSPAPNLIMLPDNGVR